MATSFLSKGDQTWYEDAVDTWFETFKKSITVNKEPIKNIVQNTTNQLLGYNESSNIVDYTYTPRNQTFDAVIKYYDRLRENLQEEVEIKLKFLDELVEIYVKKDCADYINTDKTENITFDGKTFNVFSTSVVRHYQNNTLYLFYLRETR